MRALQRVENLSLTPFLSAAHRQMLSEGVSSSSKDSRADSCGLTVADA